MQGLRLLDTDVADYDNKAKDCGIEHKQLNYHSLFECAARGNVVYCYAIPLAREEFRQELLIYINQTEYLFGGHLYGCHCFFYGYDFRT